MTETGKSKHWDELADELGADVRPPPPEPKTEAPRPVSPPPKKPRPRPEPRATNWGEVASSLGVTSSTPDSSAPDKRTAETVEDEAPRVEDVAAPQEPVVIDDGDDDVEDDAYDEFGLDFEPDLQFECNLFAGGLSVAAPKEPPPEEEKKKPSLAPPTPAETTKFDVGDRQAETVETPDRDDAAPSDDEGSLQADSTEPRPAESSVPDQERGSRTGRRRRRGRRGGKRDGQPSGPTAEPAGDAIAENSEEAPSLEAEPQGVPDEEGVARPKRKRRRGRKSSKQKTAGDAETDPGTDKPRAEELDASDEDDDGNDDQGEDGRAKHRGIPNWPETIGVIIDANIANRARRPATGSSQSRPRGRRGRGRPSGGK